VQDSFIPFWFIENALALCPGYALYLTNGKYLYVVAYLVGAYKAMMLISLS
jgi:hypothetical protein